MRILAGAPLGGASNEWGRGRRQFLSIYVPTSSQTLEMGVKISKIIA